MCVLICKTTFIRINGETRRKEKGVVLMAMADAAWEPNREAMTEYFAHNPTVNRVWVSRATGRPMTDDRDDRDLEDNIEWTRWEHEYLLGIEEPLTESEMAAAAAAHEADTLVASTQAR
jgi:murein endopeptidase